MTEGEEEGTVGCRRRRRRRRVIEFAVLRGRRGRVMGGRRREVGLRKENPSKWRRKSWFRAGFVELIRFFWLEVRASGTTRLER